jgi:hypothetical protein
MNRTHLRRIAALEAKFPPPLPDWSYLNIDELHDLKMHLVRGFIAKHKKSGSKLPLPSWVAETLDCENPKQRSAARKAAGLRPRSSVSYRSPRLVPMRKQPHAVDREVEVQSSPSLPIESDRRMLWNPSTPANERRRARANRRPRRAFHG